MTRKRTSSFEPRYVELVPQDEIDERSAYFVMVKPGARQATRDPHAQDGCPK